MIEARSTYYLDYAATTPVDDEVLQAMLPWLTSCWGNPSSLHDRGVAARRAIENAREQVAQAIEAHPGEVFFTSGATEANNWFIKGVSSLTPSGKLAVSSVEHSSVINPARQVCRGAWKLERLPVDSCGVISGSIPQADVVSLMWANNETGVVQPILSFCAQARSNGVKWIHSDAVQAFGRVPLSFRDFKQAGGSSLSLSAHKIYGPQGVGALVLDKRKDIDPLLHGGGQERGGRSGTENVAGIVGFGVASLLARERMEKEMFRLQSLKEILEKSVLTLGAHVWGARVERLATTSCFSFPGIDGPALATLLDQSGYQVSSGSACASGRTHASHVLLSMGIEESLARSAVRVSMGGQTTLQQIEGFVASLRQILQRLPLPVSQKAVEITA